MVIATGVKTRHRDFGTYANKWQRVRDVISGQEAMHNAGVRYLPMLADQKPEAYQSYLRRTTFYNASFRTVSGFNGMLFRKPPTIETDDTLQILLDDVTMSGVPFETFVENICFENLTVSRVGILVDHPVQFTNADGTTPTVAQIEQANIRPSMLMYKAESIINWKFSFIKNKNVLTQVRLLEHAEIAKNEFESEMQVNIKVLDLVDGKYRMRVFKEESEEQIGEDVYPLMNGKNLDFIPFYLISPSGIEGHLEEPIFIDLFDLNIQHYRVSADYEHGSHMTGLPTPYICGYQNTFDQTGVIKPADFYIGSSVAWVFADPQTKVGFLEFTGTGLTALEANLTRKEAQMAAIGARMLAPEKSGVEAAETLSMRHSGENSILSAIANACSLGIMKALETFAAWAGSKGKIKFEINREFLPIGVDGRTLTAWVGLVQAGMLSKESAFDLMKRGEMIDEELSYEDEQARIDSQPPPAPIAPKPGVQPAPKNNPIPA
jgi:hypothetical protein